MVLTTINNSTEYKTTKKLRLILKNIIAPKAEIVFTHSNTTGKKDFKVYPYNKLNNIILPNYMNYYEKLFLLKRLENTNVEIFTQSNVKKVENGKIYFQRGGLDEIVEPIDTVVFASGSVCCLKDDFKDIGIPVYHVGDCIKPGRMYEAFHSGYMVSREI